MDTTSSLDNQNKIELLPEHIIDQIKAGEVIERPASLLKEVIENSVDAGSTKIDIEIRDNGLELISIVDNGKGINFEDLPLAFCRHATSKIRKFEDIYSLHSYGFRGEALASIASISRVSCSSTNSQGKGGKYLIHGGEELEHSPMKSSNKGTSLYIKDLFFNTPARLKFVKSKTSEKNALKKIINAFIINNPSIDFSVRWDKEEKIFYPKVENDFREKRLQQVFGRGKKTKEEIIRHSNEYDGYSVELFISKSSTKSNSSREQFLFTNGRLFNDKAIHQIITKNLSNIWGINQFGHYSLFISAPTNEIDVNAHPSKTYIKFFKSDVIYSLVKTVAKSLNDKFQSQNAHENIISNLTQENSTENFKSNQETKVLNGNCISLGEDLSLLSKENKNYFCSHKHLFKEILISFLKENEAHSTPVLITEHVEVLDLDKLNELKELGYSFEKLKENQYMLSSFPSLLADMPYTQMAKAYLSSKSGSGIASFEDIYKVVSISSKNISRYLLDKDFNNFKSIKLLDSTLISTLFDE